MLKALTQSVCLKLLPPIGWHVLIVCAFLSNAADAEQDTIRGSTPLAMTREPELHNAVLAFLEHWSNNYDGGEISVVFQPGSRSVRDILTQKIDFHYPSVCSFYQDSPDVNVVPLPISAVPFGIYSLREKPIYLADLQDVSYQLRGEALAELTQVFSAQEADSVASVKRVFSNADELLKEVSRVLGRALNATEAKTVERVAYPYAVGTAALYAPHLPMPAYTGGSPVTGLEALFRRRFDAYITVPSVVEETIANHSNKELIERDVYSEEPMCFLVQKSKRGEEVAKILIGLYQKAIDDGTYDRLFGRFVSLNQQWVKKNKK